MMKEGSLSECVSPVRRKFLEKVAGGGLGVAFMAKLNEGAVAVHFTAQNISRKGFSFPMLVVTLQMMPVCCNSLTRLAVKFNDS